MLLPNWFITSQPCIASASLDLFWKHGLRKDLERHLTSTLKHEMFKVKGKLMKGDVYACVRGKWEVKGILTAYKVSKTNLSQLNLHL